VREMGRWGELSRGSVILMSKDIPRSIIRVSIPCDFKENITRSH
jgi:hypothetical protein